MKQDGTYFMNGESPSRCKALLAPWIVTLMVSPLLMYGSSVPRQRARLTERRIAQVAFIQLELLVNSTVVNAEMSLRHEGTTAYLTGPSLGLLRRRRALR